MRKRVVTYAVFTTTSIFMLMGFSSNPQQTEISSGKEIVHNISTENVEFVSKIPTDDTNYAGQYLYTDGDYNYYVDIDNHYLSTIIPTVKNVPTRASGQAIDENYAKTEASNYFYAILGTAISGTLKTNPLKIEGMGYVVEITESLAELETGTKASVIIGEDGKLLTAAFVKGDPEHINNVMKSNLLTESEAAKRAIEAVGNNGTSLVAGKPSFMELKTFKKRTYWQATLPVETVDNTGNTNSFNYYVQIDATNGNVLEVVHDIRQ